jgi:hypothetical protein
MGHQDDTDQRHDEVLWAAVKAGREWGVWLFA